MLGASIVDSRPIDKYNGETTRAEASPVRGPVLHERRGAKRYSVRRDLRYWVVDRSPKSLGTSGRTLDISSSGILLSTQEWIHPGRVLVVSVDWPARLDGTCPLKFVATGTVVRSAGHQLAMRIQRYEFRTRNFSIEILKPWERGVAKPRVFTKWTNGRKGKVAARAGCACCAGG